MCKQLTSFEWLNISPCDFFEIQVFFSLRGVHCSKLSMNYDRTSTRKSEKKNVQGCTLLYQKDYWEEYCRFRSIKRESFSEYCTSLFLHPPFSYCFLRLQGYAYAANDVTEVMRYKSKAILYRFIAFRYASSKAMQMMFSLYSTRDTRMLQMMTALIWTFVHFNRALSMSRVIISQLFSVFCI